MDIIDRHFAAENAHDVQATLDTYTDDIVWDDVTHPDSPFRGKERGGAGLLRDHRGHPRRRADLGQAVHRRRRALRRRRVDHHRPRPRRVGGHGRRRCAGRGPDAPRVRDPRRADLLRERLVRRRRGAAPDHSISRDIWHDGSTRLTYIGNGYIDDSVTDIVRRHGEERQGRSPHSGGASYPARALHRGAARLRDHEAGRAGVAGQGEDGAGHALRLARPDDRRRG